jgi:Tol biopolymer transport system component
LTSQTSTSSKLAIGLAPLLVAAGLLLADAVLAHPVVTERVSIDSNGVEALGDSSDPSVSGDGRYVAFSSEAENLVDGDVNGFNDVFVHDWAEDEGVTTLVSVASDGTQANGASNSPFISEDGRFVVFCSDASNLVAGDTNGFADIFVHDLTDGSTERVSVNGGVEGNNTSSSPSISADGQYVVFASTADNLVSGDTNEAEDIFLYNRQNGQLVLVSAALGSTQPANDLSENPIISADGRFVAFDSRASDLVSDDINGRGDIFVRDLTSGTTERVSVSSTGEEANNYSFDPTINDDGRYIAFRSYANNLVSDDTNYQADIFLHDRTDGSTVRVNLSSTGEEALGGPSLEASLNGDGRFVAFHSFASNLVPDDDNDDSDVFVRDLEDNGLTVRVSVDSDGVQADGPSYRPAISFDGQVVVFWSEASNLVDNDINGDADAFAHGEKPEATPEPTATPTATSTPTDTATPTETPTETPTDTPVPTDTNTPEPTDTPVPTNTDTAVPSDTPTETATASDTPTETATASDTPTDTPVPTDTPTDTPVPTDTPTNTPEPTDTPVPTDTPTNTPVPTDTPTNTPKPTNTPVPTDTPTNTPVPTDTPTNTPKPTNTPVPTDTPTNTPVPTDTPTNTPVPTDTPTNTPEPTDTPVPTDTPTNTPEPTDTPVPTDEPTVPPDPGVCPIFLDFETDANGEALQAGTFIDNEYAALGITITTNNPTAHPAMIFDTSHPTGNDDDLGSPNEDFGGPGIGRGGEEGMPGENRLPQDNVLILSQDANPNDPNDYFGGGSFIFEFDQPTDIYEIHMLDIDSGERDGVITGYDADGDTVGRVWIPALGNNSFQVLQLGFENVVRLTVKIEASGAVAGLKLCPSQGTVDPTLPPETESTVVPTVKPMAEPTPTPNSEPEATDTPVPTDEPTDTPDDDPGNYDPSKPGLSIYSCLDAGNKFHLTITNIGAAGKYRLLSSNGKILGPWYLHTGEVVGEFSDGKPITTTIEDTWSIQYRVGSKWMDTSLTYMSSVEDHVWKEDYCENTNPSPGPNPTDPTVIISASQKTIKEGETFSGAGTIVVNTSKTWTVTVDYGDGSELVELSAASNEQFKLAHVYGDNGEYVLTVSVDNENGDPISKNIIVTVNNVSPELDINGLTSYKSCRYINHLFNLRFKWRVCSDVVITYARIGEEKVFTTTAVDAGSDDLTIKWNPGSEVTYFNDGKAADLPASSMGEFPFSVTDETTIVFDEPGWHKFTLSVSDDDGGTVTRKVKVFVIQDAPCAQGLGYWKHQLSKYNRRYNRNFIQEAKLKTYLGIINAYSSIFSEEVSLKTLDRAYDVLRFEDSSLRSKANAHLLTAWFNFAQASIKWNDSIDWDGDGVIDGTFAELIKQAENILLDSRATHAEIELAKNIAEGITQYGQDTCPGH